MPGTFWLAWACSQRIAEGMIVSRRNVCTKFFVGISLLNRCYSAANEAGFFHRVLYSWPSAVSRSISHCRNIAGQSVSQQYPLFRQPFPEAATEELPVIRSRSAGSAGGL